MAGMASAYKAKDVPTFFKNNVAFTRAIYAASQNQTLIRIAAGIEKQALRYRYLAHLQSQEMLSMTLEGHSGVGEAVLAGEASRRPSPGRAVDAARPRCDRAGARSLGLCLARRQRLARRGAVRRIGNSIT